MSPLFLTYSLADQDFNQTKSIGIFNVSTELLNSISQLILPNQLCVLTNSITEDRLRLPQGVAIKRCNSAIKGRFGRVLWDQWGAQNRAVIGENNWLFLPKGFSSFLKPKNFRLSAYVHDAMHNYYINSFPGFIPPMENKYFTFCLKNTLKHANIIFTNTDFTNTELKRLAKNFNLKIPVIITAGIGFIRPNEIISKKQNYLLLLTSSWPHKLTKQAIDITARWQKQTGFSGGIELVGSLPIGVSLPNIPGWRHHLRLSELMYRRLLKEARILLFFSSYEGFGMPPVEAILTETCPVFSDLPATREIMGNKGFSFLNNSYESFAQAMNSALNVTKAQMHDWAEQLLACHSWDKVANRVINGLTHA